MVIEDSDGGGADVAGTADGASGIVGGAEDVTSGVGTIGAGGMIFVGISACYAYCACGSCSSCGGSGGAT